MSPLVMDIRLRSVQQLFNSLDPSPFVDRDLDADAEEYIVSWARELPHRGDFRLVLHLEVCPDEDLATEQQVGEAVRHYFAHRAEVVGREFTRLMREGRLSLLIGLVFMTGCMLGARFVSGLAPEHPLGVLASEGLIIGGWVAMWRPMEIFLYEWWPLARRRSIMRRLARMGVHLQKARA